MFYSTINIIFIYSNYQEICRYKTIQLPNTIFLSTQFSTVTRSQQSLDKYEKIILTSKKVETTKS